MALHALQASAAVSCAVRGPHDSGTNTRQNPMNEARFLRILRLPLITLLAINLAVLLIAPLYRARPTAGSRSTEPTVSSVPGPTPVARTQDESRSGQTENASFVTADESDADDGFVETGTRPTALTELAPSAPVVDKQEVVEPPRDRPVVHSDFGLDWEPLLAVGQQLSLPKSATEPFGRPIARVAERLSQWLAVSARLDTVSEESTGSQDFSSDSATASRLVSETDVLPRNRIVVRNPRENRLRVAFLLDEQVQTLEPGGEMVVDSVRASIRFDRGSDHGESRLVLEPGSYRFAVGKQGWRLQPEEASID